MVLTWNPQGSFLNNKDISKSRDPWRMRTCAGFHWAARDSLASCWCFRLTPSLKSPSCWSYILYFSFALNLHKSHRRYIHARASKNEYWKAFRECELLSEVATVMNTECSGSKPPPLPAPLWCQSTQLLCESPVSVYGDLGERWLLPLGFATPPWPALQPAQDII